jgi:hypothetical protein
MRNSSKFLLVVARDASQPKKLPFLLKTMVELHHWEFNK